MLEKNTEPSIYLQLFVKQLFYIKAFYYLSA